MVNAKFVFTFCFGFELGFLLFANENILKRFDCMFLYVCDFDSFNNVVCQFDSTRHSKYMKVVE
jgi:hypothetical protein